MKIITLLKRNLVILNACLPLAPDVGYNYKKQQFNNGVNLTVIPLYSIVAGELCRYI